MLLNNRFQFTIIIVSVFLASCSANNATVNTMTSPIDGKTRTTIKAPDFSNSIIYPVEGSSAYGMHIDGGSVIDKKTASIIFKTMSNSGFRTAYFKADGDRIDLHDTNVLTNFSSDKYGVYASKEFFISCEKITTVVQSTDVYLRVTFSDGFVDYDVSKIISGADGFGMIKKIAHYCS
jgi:hypothetical protein